MAAFNEDTSGQPKQQKPNEYDHLSTVALPDELEVVVWELSGADEFQKKTPHSADIANGVYEALVRRSQAHSTIAALRAKLREVVEEREAWLGASIRQQKRARTAEAEVKRLTEEKEALREALRPFAALGEEAAWMTKPDDAGAWGFDDAHLTWGDFRRARAALNSREKADAPGQ